jgi:phosphoglycolate phosphatase-like HAD superfamily hydrolase
MVIRNLILDWSGTLVDDLLPVLHTTNHVLRLHGKAELTLAGFRRDFCLPVRRFYEARIPEVPQAELEREFLAHYPQYRHEIQVLPAAKEFLRFCAATGRPVFVASSADRGTYDSRMAEFGIVELVRRAYLEIVDKTETVHQILAENGLEPAATMFVGDMEHDIAAGRAGGVRTCAVLTGYNHSEKLRALQPDLVCADLGELRRALAAEEHG